MTRWKHHPPLFEDIWIMEAASIRGVTPSIAKSYLSFYIAALATNLGFDAAPSHNNVLMATAAVLLIIPSRNKLLWPRHIGDAAPAAVYII